MGGVEDHVHILCRHSKNIAVAAFLGELKRDSSKWVKQQDTCLADFHWQGGYGAFSIGYSQVNDLINYIENQEAHHKTKTFQEEYRELLKKYNVPFDEKYVWD